jgi:hypothetical protein
MQRWVRVVNPAAACVQPHTTAANGRLEALAQSKLQTMHGSRQVSCRAASWKSVMSCSCTTQPLTAAMRPLCSATCSER